MIGKVLKITPGDKGSKWLEAQTSDGKVSMLVKATLDLGTLGVGDEADFVYDTKTSQTGKRYCVLLSYQRGSNPTVSTTVIPVTSSGLSQPELAFISNQVASAIAKGMVIQPHEITIWAKAAKDALNALK